MDATGVSDVEEILSDVDEGEDSRHFGSTAGNAAAAKEPSQWRYEPFNGKAMCTRVEPAIQATRTTHKLQPGDVLDVEEVQICPLDRVTKFLKLTGDRGWAFDQMPGKGIMCVPEESGPGPAPATSLDAPQKPALVLESEPAPPLSLAPAPAPALSLDSGIAPAISLDPPRAQTISLEAEPTPALSLDPAPAPALSLDSGIAPAMPQDPTQAPALSLEAAPTPALSLDPAPAPALSLDSGIAPAMTQDPTQAPALSLEVEPVPSLSLDPGPQPVISLDPTSEPAAQATAPALSLVPGPALAPASGERASGAALSLEPMSAAALLQNPAPSPQLSPDPELAPSISPGPASAPAPGPTLDPVPTSSSPPSLGSPVPIQPQLAEWRYEPFNGKPMTTRQTPSIAGLRTEVKLTPDEVFKVERTEDGPDGVTFICIADGRGWAFDIMPGKGTMCVLVKPEIVAVVIDKEPIAAELKAPGGQEGSEGDNHVGTEGAAMPSGGDSAASADGLVASASAAEAPVSDSVGAGPVVADLDKATDVVSEVSSLAGSGAADAEISRHPQTNAADAVESPEAVAAAEGAASELSRATPVPSPSLSRAQTSSALGTDAQPAPSLSRAQTAGDLSEARKKEKKEVEDSMAVTFDDLQKQFVRKSESDLPQEVGWEEQHELRSVSSDGALSEDEVKKKAPRQVRKSMLTRSDEKAAAALIQAAIRRRGVKLKKMAADAADRARDAAEEKFALEKAAEEEKAIFGGADATPVHRKRPPFLDFHIGGSPCGAEADLPFVGSIWDWKENEEDSKGGFLTFLSDGHLTWNYDKPQAHSQWQLLSDNQLFVWFNGVKRVMRLDPSMQFAELESWVQKADPPNSKMTRRIEEEPTSPKSMAEVLSPTSKQSLHLRSTYEGPLSPNDRKEALKKMVGIRHYPTKPELFLNMLRAKGDGSVGVAWRRFFDTDGDGELSFSEFCEALANVSYEGDSLELWRHFSGGESVKALDLSMLDKEDAAMIDAFADWCTETCGGPVELFRKVDDDGGDSLTKDEILEGLLEMGWFEWDKCPAKAGDANLFLKNLFPILDRDGGGCITADEILFLEKDPDKKKRDRAEIIRQQQCGNDGRVPLPPSEASKFINVLARDCTQLGRKHWKQIPMHQEKVPEKEKPRKKAPEKKRTPKFLRQHRMFKRMDEARSASTPELVGAAKPLDDAEVAAVSDDEHARRPGSERGSRASSAAGSRAGSRAESDSVAGSRAGSKAGSGRASSERGRERTDSRQGSAQGSRAGSRAGSERSMSRAPSLPRLPDAAPGAAAGSRPNSLPPSSRAASVDAQKTAAAMSKHRKQTRSVYRGSMVPPMPARDWYPKESAAGWYARMGNGKALGRPPKAPFDPGNCKHFLQNASSENLFGHYQG